MDPTQDARAGDAFRFVTEDDRRLLSEKARLTKYAAGDTVLEEGSLAQALYTIRKGTVRIERTHFGRDFAIARLGPGEVFGEMSFVDGLGASANVIADSDLEVEVLVPLSSGRPGHGCRQHDQGSDLGP
jgi:CRP-like cAMP-binding protein